MDLLAWGANTYGQLGLGYKCEQLLFPTIVPISSPDENLRCENIHSMAGGAGHSLILTVNGLVYSCGWNSKGQLGLETETLVFTRIETLKEHKIIQIACGWDFSAAISDKNEIYVWGSNAFRQIGLPKNIKNISVPTKLSIFNAKQVSCGLRHIAIVTIDGNVIMCGNGSKGQIGIVDESNNAVRESNLQILPNIQNIVSVACGQYHTLALNSDGTLFGWGNNKHGQLGLDPEKYPQILTPVKLNLFLRPQKIFTGWTHSVLFTGNGKLINFGRNTYGQLGSQRFNFWEPSQLECEDIKQISVGSEHNLAITSENKLLCWGWNEHGNCGTGDIDDVKIPKKILLGKKVLYAASGTGQSFAVVQNL